MEGKGRRDAVGQCVEGERRTENAHRRGSSKGAGDPAGVPPVSAPVAGRVQGRALAFGEGVASGPGVRGRVAAAAVVVVVVV